MAEESNFQQEERVSAWDSIRKLLNATKNYQVLTSEEILNLGAYFARGSRNMVTLPLTLIKAYDEELRSSSQNWTDSGTPSAAYIELHAKLEEYLPLSEVVAWQEELRK